jgi:hypothetical protein
MIDTMWHRKREVPEKGEGTGEAMMEKYSSGFSPVLVAGRPAKCISACSKRPVKTKTRTTGPRFQIQKLA